MSLKHGDNQVFFASEKRQLPTVTVIGTEEKRFPRIKIQEKHSPEICSARNEEEKLD